MVQKKVEYVLTTSHQAAVRGFRKVRDSISQTNQKIREMQILGRGVENVNKQVNKLANINERILGATRGSNYHKNLANLNKQAAKGAEEFKGYGKEVGIFNKEIKDMSSLSKISSRDVRKMTSDFNRFVSGVRAFENFDPKFIQEHAASGRFTGRNWAAFRHTGDSSSDIPMSPRLMATAPAVGSENATFQFSKLSSQMDYFAENLSNMNKEAADVAKVFGDTTLVTSKFKDVLAAFAKPNLIDIEKMSKGPMAGKYGLRGSTGEMIPGTPGFDTEQEAQRFVSVVGNMRESMEKTTRSQETQQRRQGITFTNLLGLMIKFGVAMQLIEAPGKAIAEYNRMVDQAIDFEHEIAKGSTLIKELRDDPEKRKVVGMQVAEIAALNRVIGENAVANQAVLVTELASSLENIPPSPAKVVQGVEMGPEIATALNLLDAVTKLSIASLAEDPRDVLKAYTRLQAAYGVPVEKMAPYERQFIATIDFGDINARQLADIQGELVGLISSTYGTKDKDLLEEMHKQWLAVIATGTITLPPEIVATGVRNVFKTAFKPPVSLQEDLIKLRDKSAANPNMETIDLTGASFLKGPEHHFANIEKNLGIQGVLTTRALEASEGQKQLVLARDYWGDPDVAELMVRRNIAAENLGIMNPNVRGKKLIQGVGIDEGERMRVMLNNIREEVKTDIVSERADIVMGTPKSLSAESDVRKTIRDIKIVNTNVFEQTRGAILRSEQDVDKKYGPVIQKLVHTARWFDPTTHRNWPGVYNPWLDIERVSKAVQTGVKPADLHTYLTTKEEDPITGEVLGKYPGAVIPGLAPGKGALRNFIASVEELVGGPDRPALFGADYSHLDFLKTYLEENPSISAANSIDFLRTYLEESPSVSASKLFGVDPTSLDVLRTYVKENPSISAANSIDFLRTYLEENPSASASKLFGEDLNTLGVLKTYLEENPSISAANSIDFLRTYLEESPSVSASKLFGVDPTSLDVLRTYVKENPSISAANSIDFLRTYLEENPSASASKLFGEDLNTLGVLKTYLEENPSISAANSIDFLRTYLEESPSVSAGISGGQTTVDEINLYITVTGSGASTEEDGRIIGDEVINALHEIFELESYSGSEISTLYRNDAYESGTFN